MRLPQLRTLQTCVCPTEFAACRVPTPGFARLSWSRFCNGCVQRPFCLPAGGSRLVRARPSLLRWEPHEVPQAPAARGLQSSCTCNTWLPGAGGSCAWDAPAGWEVRWSEPLPAHAAARAAPVDRSPAGPAGRSGARPQAQPRAWVPVSVASARPRLPRAGAAGRRSAGQGRRGRGPGAAAPPRTDLSIRRPAACWDVSLLPVSSLLIFLWTQETVAAGAAPSLARAQRLLLTGCNPREKVRGPRPAPSPPAGSARPPVAAGSPKCASRAGCALGSDPVLPFRANVLKGEKSQFSKTQGDSGAGGARRGGPQGRPAGAAASGRPAGLARAVPVRLPRRAQAVLCRPPLRHLPPSGPSPSRGARGWVARVSEDASGPSDRPRWSLLSPGLGTEPPRGRLSGRAHETSGSQGPAGGRGACGRRGWPRLPGSQA